MISKKQILQAVSLCLLLSYLYTAGRLVRSSFNQEENRASTILGNFVVTPTHQDNMTETPPHGNAFPLVVAPEKLAKPSESTEVETTNKKMQPSTTKLLPENFVPKVYKSGNWDLAPIVVEEYKLLFFTQGKVACTEFKKLLRRMMNLEDWIVHREPKIPHDPKHNGLKYLYHYPKPKALQMLTDPAWTRAIFVRDPKERFLSAYLDKAANKNGLYVDRHCCRSDMHKENSCGKNASRSLQDFFSIVRERCCCDAHWKKQSWRIDKELWEYVNFVGQFDSLGADTRLMLNRLGLDAWEKFGASGWGEFRNESIFLEDSTSKHRTSARTKMLQYFNDTNIEAMVDEFYAEDYARFNFTRYRLTDA